MISTTENAPLVAAADVWIKQRSPGRVCSHSALPSGPIEASSRARLVLIGISFLTMARLAVRTSAASIAEMVQDAVDRNHRQAFFRLRW
jgi:hypothetical protein